MTLARRGAAAIEFALVTPFIVFTVFGVIEFSSYITHVTYLQRAARDGARVGSLTLEGPEPTGALITEAAEAHAREVLQVSGIRCEGGCTVAATWQDRFRDGTRWVEVQVAAPYRRQSTLFPALARPTAQFVMRTQQQPPPTP